MTKRCLCGCGRPPTGHYRVFRGHGDRVKPAPRPALLQERKSSRRAPTELRMTHIKDEPKPALQPKQCLRCERQFMSWGPGNWLCTSCRGVIEANPSPVEEYHFLTAKHRARS